MKKIFCQLCCLVLLLSAGFGFSSCSNDGEIVDKGFNQIVTSFMPIDIISQYRVTYNGQELPAISKGEDFVKIEVFEINSDSEQPVLVADKWPATEPITFIRSVGRNLEVYSKDNYLEFTPTVSFSESATNYSVQFEDHEFSAGINYIAKEDLPGTLSIKKKEDGATLYSEEITENTPQTLTLIQISTTEFLKVTEENQPEDPAEGTFKARFLYTQGDFPDYPELKLALYHSTTGFEEISEVPFVTITLKANEFSEYVTVNPREFNQENVAAVYDLIDPNDENNYIVNSLEDLDTGIVYGNYGNKYKFVTLRITDISENHQGHNYVRVDNIGSLSVAW